MSVAPSEIWSRLVQFGFADPADCQKYAAAFSKATGGVPPNDADADAIVAFLVRSGVLNRYQGKRMLDPVDPGLRIGSFVISSDQPVIPFSHWLPVQTAADILPGERRKGYLLRVPLASLSETVRSWLAIHSEIQCDSLQPVQLSGGAESADTEHVVEIFSSLPDGGSLLKVLQGSQRLSRRKTVRLGVDLAKALHAMHAHPLPSGTLTHGAIGADHVWITPKGHGVLLRDPSAAPRTPHSDLSASWIDRHESPAQYAAPELADPNASNSVASDLYALGCLLFSLLTGRSAFQGSTPEQLFEAHRSVVPPDLAAAAAGGASGDPILRVLAYAMAKDPAARFASAEIFAEALARAGEASSDGKLKVTTGDQPSSVAPDAEPRSDLSDTERSSGDNAETFSIPRSESPASSVAEATPGYAVSPAAGKTDSQPSGEPANAVADAAASVNVSSDGGVVEGDAKPKTNQHKKSKRKRKPKPPSTTEPAALSKPESPEPIPAQDVATPPNPSAPVAPPSSPVVAESPSLPRIVIDADANSPPTIDTSDADDASAPSSDASSDSSRGQTVGVEKATRTVAGKRKRRRRQKNRIPIIAGLMVIPVLMLGLAIALRGRPVEEPRKAPRPRPNAGVNVPRVAPSRREPSEPLGPTRVSGYEIVDSDRLLWVPPYPADSPPPPLSLLPPGPAGIVSVPISKVLSSPSTQPLVSAFEMELEGLFATAAKRAGVPKESIKRCTVGFFPGRDGWPEIALSIELAEAVKLKTLVQSWDVGASPVEGGAYIYVGEDLDGDVYYIGGSGTGKPSDDMDVTRFAVGPMERIREVAENGGASIPLVRQMKTLWDAASEESDFVALFTPNFLLADGRQMVLSSVPEFRETLKQWLIPNVAAVSFNLASKDSALYLELREIPSGNATAATLMNDLRESIQQWPEWADNFILRSVPDPSWRLLAMRLPLMLRFVGQQVRSSIAGESVVASAYLPTEAASQVSLATLLAMNTPLSAAATTTKPTTEALTVAEMLDRPMSVSFLQQSLQFAVNDVVTEFTQSLPPGSTMPEVRIVGGDLELNGITQNQQIRGFEKSNVPLRSVLTDLVLGANPDKTATGPKDLKQSLIWVVHPTGASPEGTEILITTRDAAKTKNYELPPEFQPE